ncbi:hypothetical protein N5I28_16495 [Pseudomonas mosselii]|uniref:hypothetical protein n=1 Tax=Pseudomonas mosselii TaxID=78327 RepID=UPI000A75D791|nr:hypothetical protein [Pseudomonas mosselii]MDH1511349.1 hypothetical protein [Pseudomonas mosselii]
MSKYHEREVLNAGTLGTYRMHSLFTRISSSGDMDVPEKEMFKNAVALHAHEYTHYLHNLTTSAGLDALLACFWLIPHFVRNTDKNGRYTAPKNEEKSDIVDFAFKLMRSARGFTEGIPQDKQFKWPRVTAWKFAEPQSESVSVSIGEDFRRSFSIKTVLVTAISRTASPLEITLSPGLDFISEGIAYEVEREQCLLSGIDGKDVDSQTPSYPYLAYQPFIDHFVGRPTTPLERITIGNLALMTPSPSNFIFELCSALNKDFLNGTKKNYVFNKIGAKIRAAFKAGITKSELSQVSQIKMLLGGSVDLMQGAELFCSLIDKGLELRSERTSMELLFVERKLTPYMFRSATASLLERLVCQEKVEPPHKIQWTGSKDSIVARSGLELQKLGVLQTAIHYLQQHFTNQGALGDTAELLESVCPFEGACPQQNGYKDPDLCKTKPWNVSVGDGKSQVCWYEAGRLSLRLDRENIGT